jgi:DNA processing protein
MMPLVNTEPIYPLKEMIAYETLWTNKNASFKKIAQLFAEHPNSRPSDFVDRNKFQDLESEIRTYLLETNKHYKTNVLIKGTFDFPEGLKDAKEPLELLYYVGNLDFLKTKRIAIIGTRQPSNEGLAITKDITEKLIKDDFTIVSGLAAGIDTQAHLSAIAANGRTIAVLGTPLNSVYPRENETLQNTIAKGHLLVSQVPFYRYSKQTYHLNRLFFLERNKTMSALTLASLIIEAGETSGSLTQATAAIDQGRKLLIWESCFHNKEITWPAKFEAKGAIRVKNYEDVKAALKTK